MMPEDVLQVLIEGLGALEAELWEMASGEGQTWMSEAGDWLQSRVKSSLEEKPPGEWVYSLLRIGIAANQLARSVANIHTIKIAWKESTNNETPTQSHAIIQSKQIDNPGKKSGYGG